MAWKKDTINSSKMNIIIKYLDMHHIRYNLYSLGTVFARGCNDFKANRTLYFIRQLSFDQTVVLEQMIRDPSPEAPDFIVSKAFKRKDVPIKYSLEVSIKRKHAAF